MLLLAPLTTVALIPNAGLPRHAVTATSMRPVLHPSWRAPVAPSTSSRGGVAQLAEVAGVPFSQLSVGVLKETFPLEKRVVQSPDSVKLLTKAGFHVNVQAGAGAAALFSDADYEAVGAKIVKDAKEAYGSDIVLKIRAPSTTEAKLLGDRTLIAMLNPAKNDALLTQLQEQGATAFSLDCIPRMLSRGQT